MQIRQRGDRLAPCVQPSWILAGLALRLSLVFAPPASAQGEGVVVAWGDEAKPPGSVGASTPGSATAIVLGSGNAMSCAIQSETRGVICWGPNTSLFQAPPESVDGTTGTASVISVGGSIFSGSYHNCAIQAGTGAVICWGSNQDNRLIPPASVDGTAGKASAISTGGSVTLAIAVPEPDANLLVLAGISMLAALRWRRGKGDPGRGRMNPANRRQGYVVVPLQALLPSTLTASGSASRSAISLRPGQPKFRS